MRGSGRDSARGGQLRAVLLRHTHVLQLSATVLRALMMSMVLVVLACTTRPTDRIAGPGATAATGEPTTTSPPVRPWREVRERQRAEATYAAVAHYGVVGDPDRLVARRILVTPPGAGGNPVLAALERASTTGERGLVALVPSRAFTSAGFDGFGRHGVWGLQLRRPHLARRPAGWSEARARLAVRAVLCTVSSFDGRSDHPISVYPPGGRPEVDRLLGAPLPADRRPPPARRRKDTTALPGTDHRVEPTQKPPSVLPAATRGRRGAGRAGEGSGVEALGLAAAGTAPYTTAAPAVVDAWTATFAADDAARALGVA